MFDQKISQFKDLPLEDKDRCKTDIVCTIISALFALTMFILAIALMNTDHYNQSNFPTDADHVPCAYGINNNYPFVYFPDIMDINTRVCVSRCPDAADVQLICRANSKIPSCAIDNIYSSQVSYGRLGGFCAPLDTASQKRLFQTANLSSKWNFLNIYDCIRISLLIALGIGLLWVCCVQLIPKVMATIITVLAIITLFSLGIIIFSGNVTAISSFWQVLIGILFLGIAVLFAFFLCFYRRRNSVITIFLEWSTRFMKQHLILFVYIFIFIGLTAGLIVLCMFQHLAYLSYSKPQQEKGDIYLKLTTNVPLFILNVVQFIWGLQFLKDTFNFIISGLAVQWYTESDSSFGITFKRLIKYHFGSVAGGSFLNAFFNIINFILQSIRCYRDGACPLFASCYQCLCGCNKNFFQLVRTDVYSYINLTGIAYCNAARNCEYLMENYTMFVGCQSVLYFYRISAYCFTVGAALIVTISIQKSRLDGTADFISLIFSCILTYCLLNYFIDLHANIAEGIQISYLIQQSLGSRDNKPSALGNDKFEYKQEIHAMQKQYQDGTCC